MKVEQLYTNCLAQGAYYISHKGEAAIIDPLRETKPYLDLLKQNKVNLKYIFETHFHADFVSGHIDLAKQTGAKIIFGPNAQTEYSSYVAKDEEEFRIGDLTLKTLHTPGHTLESTCYLLSNENKKPVCIFTGDTLFIGDVGRPDLAIKSNLTKEDLAGFLYDSLREKIMPLPNDIIVYPAHGAGSSCGKNISKETFDTLGNQKKTNYALKSISKEQFIQEVITGILPAPNYFSKNALMNKNGYMNHSEVLDRGLKSLNVAEFKTYLLNHKTIVLDVRKADEYAAENIPGSLFIGLEGQFAPWVGTLISDINSPILLITPKGSEEETVKRLSRVGYDNCVGYLEGGISSWKNGGNKIESIETTTAENFYSENYKKGIDTIDVRKPREFESSHLKAAENKPLDFIHDWISEKDKSKPYVIHCAGGYRSMIAISILKSHGYLKLINLNGGYNAINKIKALDGEIVSQNCIKN